MLQQAIVGLGLRSAWHVNSARDTSVQTTLRTLSGIRKTFYVAEAAVGLVKVTVKWAVAAKVNTYSLEVGTMVALSLS